MVARLIRGVAAGGEVGASMSLLVESAPPNRRGFYSSWSLATQGIATVVGGVTALALSAALPVLSGEPNAMAEWGWRIPFFIGVALAPLGCWLRLGLRAIGRLRRGLTSRLRSCASTRGRWCSA